MKKLVYGIGVNDADYSVHTNVHGKRVMCPFYSVWSGMLERTASKWQSMYPTYIGCKVCDEWVYFTQFKAWMENQSWQGNQLDKDLLGSGKLYSPANCVFVSQEVNKFTLGSDATRGTWPIGVYLNIPTNKFLASIRVRGKPKHLGLFGTPEEAHEAWRKAKKARCLELIEQQTCTRVKRGLRKYLRII
jgi:hypothetical protein